MKRSAFVSLAGTATLLALSGKYSAFAQPPTGGKLVNTPEKRQDYTRRLLKELCTDIGPRPCGSEGFARGAKIIRKEMELSLPQVSYDTFEFEKWELVSVPEFILAGQRIEVVPVSGGNGTPEEGIKGVLKKTSTGFSLVDALSGQTKVLFSIAPFSKAITSYQSRTQPPALPSFSIGKQDVPLLERGVQNKASAWIKARVRFIPHTQGLNIVGRIPGKRKEEIIFLAHADTVYSGPGANDNTASVIVMLMLAHAAAARGCDHTLTFVATDNEEFGLMGAKHYGEKRLSDNTMKNMRFVVNFDSLTYGPNLWISSKQDDIKNLIRTIHKDLNIKSTPIFDDSDGFVMDSEPFRPSGAKALHANSRGYDEKTLPVYHRPDDNANNVPLDCVEIGFLVFDEFIRRVDKM
jgi:hypothetical protein